eukprot:PhF_6_TR2247/c1_g1_i1/m.3833
MEPVTIKVDVDGETVLHQIYLDSETGLDIDINSGKMSSREETEEVVRSIYRVGRETLKDDIHKTTDWHRKALYDSGVNLQRFSMKGGPSNKKVPEKPKSKYDPEILKEKSPEELKALGNEALSLGKPIDAVAVYDVAIRKLPTAVLYANRAEANLRLHKYTEALTDTCNSIRMDPTYGKAYFRKGVALVSLGHPEDALKAFKSGLAHIPTGPGRSDFEKKIQEVELSMRAVKTRSEPGLGVVAYAAVPFAIGQCVLCEPPLLTWSQSIEQVAPEIRALAEKYGIDGQLFRMLDPFISGGEPLHRVIYDMYAPELPMNEFTIRLLHCITEMIQTIDRFKSWNRTKLLQAIMTCRVNSHQCALITAEGEEMCGVFPTACRLMHSCTPNLIYHRHRGIMKFVATRPIAENEVLSFSYVAGKTLVESNWRRRDQLRKVNMFTCKCSRCVGIDWTRGFRCVAKECSGVVRWCGSYRDRPDLVIPMMSFESCAHWECSSCKRRHYDYEIPLDAEAGLEAALDAINSEDMKVENKYHNLKQLMGHVLTHLGEHHWVFAQLCVLLCKYHKVMAGVFQVAAPELPLALESQYLSLHWGFRYLKFLEGSGTLFTSTAENFYVTQAWIMSLGRSCTRFEETKKYARDLYEKSLPYMAAIYGEDDDAVMEMGTFVSQCKEGGDHVVVSAIPWEEPFVGVDAAFDKWESVLKEHVGKEMKENA